VSCLFDMAIGRDWRCGEFMNHAAERFI
jgi:hypothetical protein